MKYLFLDRDGTLVVEPGDFQVDSLAKVRLLPGVIPALLRCQALGYRFVMVSNQDGLGTDEYPQEDFDVPQELIVHLFESQGIAFDEILVCPHWESDRCDCRKPKPGLLLDYLRRTDWDRSASYVIGDRETDMELAKNMGIEGILIDQQDSDWATVPEILENRPRRGECNRTTNETSIQVKLDLDGPGEHDIDTGIRFLDHMLEQLSKHGNIRLEVRCSGDLDIDDHHSVEDIGLSIGAALAQAIGEKRGIERFGFLLPMDESLARVALDFSGRPVFCFSGEFPVERVGDLSTQMVPHFFQSLATAAGLNLNISVTGDNGHHMVESIFKAVARALRQAVTVTGEQLPSTKGVL